MQKLPLLLLALPLVACQAGGPSAHRLSSDLPAVNSRLVLNQEIAIRAGSAHATLQGGRIVDGAQFNHYHPYCQIEVRKVTGVAQQIHPDTFLIRRAYQETRQHSNAGGLVRVAGGRGNGGPTHFVFRTVFDLTSPRQPDVLWMICEQWGDPALGSHPTLEEIRVAIDGYFVLNPPAR